MQTRAPTTPFGRRPLTLAHVATQIVATSRPPEKVVHKWKIFQALCTARPKLGVSERSLAVLNALLTFHPETALTGEDDLIVFSSNVQLSLRSPWHADLNVETSSGGLGRCWPDRSPGLTERQALCQEGYGREDRSRLRLRHLAVGCPFR